MPIDFPVVKYADPSYTDVAPTDDDKVMLRTAAGTDARASMVQPKGYIDGLNLVYVSGTQIQLTSGAAYIPSAKRIVELSSTLTKNVTLAGNTLFHVYLIFTSGTADFEVVATAPSTPYYGTARTKTGDTSRRYVGSLRTNPTGVIFSFVHTGTSYYYDVTAAGTAPFRVVNNATNTATVAVSVADSVPVSAYSVLLKGDSTASNSVVVSLGRNGPGGSIFQGSIFNGQRSFWDIALSNQQFSYAYSGAPTGGGVYFDIIGYRYER